MTTQEIRPGQPPTECRFRDAPRRQEALTATVERRFLRWAARQLPRWIGPDRLTLLGILGQLLAGVGYALARQNLAALHLANLGLLLNWLGDSLDGTVARVRGVERPRYGFYVDHMVDVLGSVLLLAGMAVSGLLSPLLAAALLCAFLVLAAESYLATYTLGRFELSQGLFGPTELRLLLVAGNLFVLRHRWVTLLGRRMPLFDVGAGIATAGMVALAVRLAVRHTAELRRAEPGPSPVRAGQHQD